MNPALVLGLSPTGLIAVRSLGRRGVPVFGADSNRWGIGRYSRYCNYRPDLSEASRLKHDDELVDALLAFAAECSERPVLYLTNDEYIERLSPHFGKLARSFLFSTDLTHLGQAFLNKRRFYELCETYGLDLPATYFPASTAEVEEIGDLLEYPAIIKPGHIHHFYSVLKGKKVARVNDAAELMSAWRRLSKIESNLIVQEVIPGPDSAILVAACYVDQESRLGAIFSGRKIRQYPPRFGSACLAESYRERDLLEQSVAFLQDVGFRGICGTEFKRDPRDGRLKMIEVNPRLTLWMGLAGASGVDIPYIAYSDVTCGTYPETDQIDGLRWTYLIRDVQSAVYYMSTGELSIRDWLRSLRGIVNEAILAKDDFKVGLYVPAYGIARLLRRAG